MNYVNLILEITFQIYSYNILKLCSSNIELTTSKILKCYKINTGKMNEYKNLHRNIFYIEMDRVQDGILLQDIQNNIKNNKCRSFVNLIHHLNDCLITHGIYHNDLNPGNIFLSTNANGNIVKITIIDFGQSLDKLNGPSKEYGIINYECNTNSKLKIKRVKNINANFF
jgi:serine/threonine protein kinase